MSLGDREMVPKGPMPDNTKKIKHWLTINGQSMEALRDTGASMTTVRCHLVSSEQVIPSVVHQVVTAGNQVSHYPLTLVPLEWGGFRCSESSC